MRSTVILLLLISFVGVEFARSQSAELIVSGTGRQALLPHTVVAKENWYSIGRLYNGGAKEIASFNGLALDKPLSIGQELKIPLTPINFSQTGLKSGPAETLVPSIISSRKRNGCTASASIIIKCRSLASRNGIISIKTRSGPACTWSSDS